MPFQFQPTLKGEHIYLRPLTDQDFEPLYAAASDPLIWEQHPAKRYQRKVFSDFFADSLASGGALVVLDASRNGLSGEAVVGTSRYNGYDEAKSEIEIGWSFLKREYWGGSHNREMKKLMLDHAFLFVENVIFKVDSNNVRSQKAVQKIGGKFDNSYPLDDGRTAVVYRITRSGYIL